MSRHLGNLQHVLSKLRARYGEQDAVVQQLQQEIATHEAKTATGPALPVPERRRVAGRVTQRRNDSLTVLAPRAWRMAQGSSSSQEPRH